MPAVLIACIMGADAHAACDAPSTWHELNWCTYNRVLNDPALSGAAWGIQRWDDPEPKCGAQGKVGAYLDSGDPNSPPTFDENLGRSWNQQTIAWSASVSKVFVAAAFLRLAQDVAEVDPGFPPVKDLIHEAPGQYPDSAIGNFLATDSYFKSGAYTDPDASTKRNDITYAMLLTHTAGLLSSGSWAHVVTEHDKQVEELMGAFFWRLEKHYGTAYVKPGPWLMNLCTERGYVGVPGANDECIYQPGLGWKHTRKNTLREVARYVLRQPLEHAPLAQLDYESNGIVLMAWVIEEVAKELYGPTYTFERVMREKLFLPLGMNDTFYWPFAASSDQKARVAHVPGFFPDENGEERFDGPMPTPFWITKPLIVNAYRGTVWDRYRGAWTYPLPEGGAMTTVADVLKFMQMIERGGGAGYPLTKDSVQVLLEQPFIKHAGVSDEIKECRTLGFWRTATYWGLNPETQRYETLRCGDRNNGPELSPGSVYHAGYSGTLIFLDQATGTTGVFLSQVMSEDGKPWYNQYEQGRVFAEHASQLAQLPLDGKSPCYP